MSKSVGLNLLNVLGFYQTLSIYHTQTTKKFKFFQFFGGLSCMIKHWPFLFGGNVKADDLTF